MDYRSSAAFAILVATVVVAVVGTVLLLNDGGSGESKVRAPSGPALPCQVEWMGGPVRILPSAGDASCAKARDVFATFEKKVQRHEVSDAYEPSPVGSWTCQEYPFADYPLLMRCGRGKLQIEMIGVAPSAHLPLR